MEYEKGKLYQSESGHTVILCTGPGKTENTFSGVVVERKEYTTEDFLLPGSHSGTWHRSSFILAKSPVTLDNGNWVNCKIAGTCPG